jgi:alpha-ketoglutarate-dependent taurine dioxygenase
MPLVSTELTPHVGLEIAGADAAYWSDPARAAECLGLLNAHGVLVYRDAHVSDRDLVGFSRLLGDVVPNRTSEHEFPEIATITLDPTKTDAILAHYRQGNFLWHIDGAYDVLPQRATLLTAREVDPAGGDTEFATTYAAYESLSDEDKALIADLKVVHSFAAAQLKTFPDASSDERAGWERVPAQLHPLVWTRKDGRKSLLLGATAGEVVGVEPDEGKALLNRLLEWSTQPTFSLRHTWHVGDLVVWDNTGMLHRALPFEPTSRRLMHRTTLVGIEAVA